MSIRHISKNFVYGDYKKLEYLLDLLTQRIEGINKILDISESESRKDYLIAKLAAYSDIKGIIEDMIRKE